jgi:hypothetical protein
MPPWPPKKCNLEKANRITSAKAKVMMAKVSPLIFKNIIPIPNATNPADTPPNKRPSQGLTSSLWLRRAEVYAPIARKPTCPKLTHPILKIKSHPMAKILAMPHEINIPTVAGPGNSWGKKTRTGRKMKRIFIPEFRLNLSMKFIFNPQ